MQNMDLQLENMDTYTYCVNMGTHRKSNDTHCENMDTYRKNRYTFTMPCYSLQKQVIVTRKCHNHSQTANQPGTTLKRKRTKTGISAQLK